jgi:hypothetical protein
VDRGSYDNSIEILKNTIEEARPEKKEKCRAIKRLKDFLDS